MTATVSKVRLILGGSLFVVGFLAPLFIPLVIMAELSVELTAMISGLLMLGIPEISMLAAVSILGESGYGYLKSKLSIKLQTTVSRSRYRIGLVLFLSPILLGWLLPYVLYLFPRFFEQSLFYLLALSLLTDLVLVISIFVLGGNFWHKLRVLFIYDAK